MDKVIGGTPKGSQSAWVSHAVKMIADERQRQVSKEGWTPEHDNEHTEGDLALAAACYAAPIPIRGEVTSTVQCGCREASCEHTFGIIEKKEWKDPWPWDKKWDKREKHDRIRQLVIAGALIVAEIDRLNRALPSPPTGRTNPEAEGR